MIRNNENFQVVIELCQTICILALLMFGPGLFLGWLIWG
nr:MAG TPA: hypothetical protein [Caudoviricetes sp.]